MKRILLLAIAMAFAAAALAQSYRWVDKDGKVRYGDTPPPGVKATALKPPSRAPAVPPAKGDDKAAPKGPLSPAEQEQEFRKRRLEAEKAGEKAAQEERETQLKKDNCTRAQNQLRIYESGQRVARTDQQGERYYLEEQQIAQEAAKAREQVGKWCN